MIKPGRAGAGCTQFPFFMWRRKSCQPPQTNWLSLKSALKGPNCHYFYAAGTCIGLRLRLCLATSQASSRLFQAGKPIWRRKEFLRFDRIPVLQSASGLCVCSTILPVSS
jgi:hypothetical protein